MQRAGYLSKYHPALAATYLADLQAIAHELRSPLSTLNDEMNAGKAWSTVHGLNAAVGRDSVDAASTPTPGFNVCASHHPAKRI
jgi:hypothetical protein